MDFRKIIKVYMQTIIDLEGASLVGCVDTSKLTKDERDILCDINKEIRREMKANGGA